jgi:hypothetical protein
MAQRFVRIPKQTVVAVVAVVALALIVALVLAPRASGQEPQTITFDVVINSDSQALVPAPGHDGNFPTRGDVLSGQGAVYAAGDTAGDRLGTFYYEAVATSDVENVETAANHLYAHGFVELWGQGSLAVTGTVNFLGTPTYLAVIGGTGAYAASSGQCTLISGDTTDSWSCDIQ